MGLDLSSRIEGMGIGLGFCMAWRFRIRGLGGFLIEVVDLEP